jgi:hypothetical protein
MGGTDSECYCVCYEALGEENIKMNKYCMLVCLL